MYTGQCKVCGHDVKLSANGDYGCRWCTHVGNKIDEGMQVDGGEYHEPVGFGARGCRDHQTKVVAEIGTNADGSLGNAIALMEAALQYTDFIKFQYHNPYLECTPESKFPARFKYHPQDKARSDYWYRQWYRASELKEINDVAYANSAKLIFSVFSIQGLNAVLDNAPNVWAIKIPSGEVDNLALIDAVSKCGKVVILSSGMSDTREINTSATMLLKAPVKELYVLQCTTEYPTKFEHVGLNVAECYSRNLLWKGGLSDHSGTIYPGVIAAYLGAYMVETHVCFHKQQFGPDISSSLTIDEFFKLCEGVHAATIMRSNPINKDLVVPTQEQLVYRQGSIRKEFNKYENENNSSNS